MEATNLIQNSSEPFIPQTESKLENSTLLNPAASTHSRIYAMHAFKPMVIALRKH